jgi:hypothetical protein
LKLLNVLLCLGHHVHRELADREPTSVALSSPDQGERCNPDGSQHDEVTDPTRPWGIERDPERRERRDHPSEDRAKEDEPEPSRAVSPARPPIVHNHELNRRPVSGAKAPESVTLVTKRLEIVFAFVFLYLRFRHEQDVHLERIATTRRRLGARRFLPSCA